MSEVRIYTKTKEITSCNECPNLSRIDVGDGDSYLPSTSKSTNWEHYCNPKHIWLPNLNGCKKIDNIYSEIPDFCILPKYERKSNG